MMNGCTGARRPQSGVALISVLLVFALAVMIASQVISRHFRDIRKTANLINTRQAYYYAIAGEQFARQILYRDFINESTDKTDTLVDSWAQDLDVFEIENGRMSIAIVDLQSRFNINNLRDSGVAAFEFRQLLNGLDTSSDYTPLLQDWLDDDSAALAGGGEDEVYLSYRNAYLAANREMSDKSELRLLNELTVEDYNRLKDYVVALPVGTKYNLNTLDAKIVKALSNQITDAEVSLIERRQQQGGYLSVSQWLSNEAKDLAALGDRLSVHSEYFEVEVKAVYDERISVVRTQLFRDPKNGQIQVLKRQQGFE